MRVKMPNFDVLRSKFRSLGDPEHTRSKERYFKSGPGSQDTGDVFLGIRMPQIREFLKSCRHLEPSECIEFLQSELHEERMLGLLLLVQRYKKGSEAQRAEIYSAYLENIDAANQWDLVDQSAHLIIGPHLQVVGAGILRDLANSPLWWRRRVAIVSTLHLIRNSHYDTTFEIARVLLQDEHDLLQKAVGWMIKEISQRDVAAAVGFLSEVYREMPRTMLRCAIEKLDPEMRQAFLKGHVTSRRAD